MNDIEEGDMVIITEVNKYVSYPKEQILGTVHRVISIDEPSPYDLLKNDCHYWLKGTPCDKQFWTRDEIEPATDLELAIRNIEDDI